MPQNPSRFGTALAVILSLPLLALPVMHSGPAHAAESSSAAVPETASTPAAVPETSQARTTTLLREYPTTTRSSSTEAACFHPAASPSIAYSLWPIGLAGFEGVAPLRPPDDGPEYPVVDPDGADTIADDNPAPRTLTRCPIRNTSARLPITAPMRSTSIA